MPAPAPAPVVRQWSLARRCAMTPQQLILSFTVLTLATGLICAVFAMMGYWPVMLYWSLQTALIAGMCLFYMYHAADGERISLDTSGLLEVEVLRGNTVTRHAFCPAWTRLERTGRVRQRLWLKEGSRRVELGTHLTDQQRASLGKDLARELRQCRYQA